MKFSIKDFFRKCGQIRQLRRSGVFIVKFSHLILVFLSLNLNM